MRSALILIIVLFPFLGLAANSNTKDSLENSINIVAVGDMMLGSNFPFKYYLPSDPYDLIKDVQPILESGDITFGNLEGAILDNGPVVKRCKDTTKCYAFKMPEDYIDVFNWAGFDLVSLANNHIYDFGWKGAAKTCELLDSAGIEYAGLLNKTYTIINHDSLKIGFVAFSPNNGTLDINKLDEGSKIIKELEGKVDITIVSFHGGAEGSSHQHIGKGTEMFYGENRGDVMNFAHLMIDSGADVILGHGPHVTRAFEIYKGKFVIYSMGNFCTYARFNLSGPNGISPIVSINVNSKGDFVSGKIIPTKQTGKGIVKIDTENKVIHKINDLIKQDLPESKNLIDGNGEILYIR